METYTNCTASRKCAAIVQKPPRLPRDQVALGMSACDALPGIMHRLHRAFKADLTPGACDWDGSACTARTRLISMTVAHALQKQ